MDDESNFLLSNPTGANKVMSIPITNPNLVETHVNHGESDDKIAENSCQADSLKETVPLVNSYSIGTVGGTKNLKFSPSTDILIDRKHKSIALSSIDHCKKRKLVHAYDTELTDVIGLDTNHTNNAAPNHNVSSKNFHTDKISAPICFVKTASPNMVVPGYNADSVKIHASKEVPNVILCPVIIPTYVSAPTWFVDLKICANETVPGCNVDSGQARTSKEVPSCNFGSKNVHSNVAVPMLNIGSIFHTKYEVPSSNGGTENAYVNLAAHNGGSVNVQTNTTVSGYTVNSVKLCTSKEVPSSSVNSNNAHTNVTVPMPNIGAVNIHTNNASKAVFGYNFNSVKARTESREVSSSNIDPKNDRTNVSVPRLNIGSVNLHTNKAVPGYNVNFVNDVTTNELPSSHVDAKKVHTNANSEVRSYNVESKILGTNKKTPGPSGCLCIMCYSSNPRSRNFVAHRTDNSVRTNTKSLKDKIRNRFANLTSKALLKKTSTSKSASNGLSNSKVHDGCVAAPYNLQLSQISNQSGFEVTRTPENSRTSNCMASTTSSDGVQQNKASQLLDAKRNFKCHGNVMASDNLQLSQISNQSGFEVTRTPENSRTSNCMASSISIDGVQENKSIQMLNAKRNFKCHGNIATPDNLQLNQVSNQSGFEVSRTAKSSRISNLSRSSISIDGAKQNNPSPLFNAKRGVNSFNLAPLNAVATAPIGGVKGAKAMSRECSGLANIVKRIYYKPIRKKDSDVVNAESIQSVNVDNCHLEKMNGRSSGKADIVQQENIQKSYSNDDHTESKNSQHSGLTDTVQPESTQTNSNDVEHVVIINGKSSGLADTVPQENIQTNNSFDESKNGQCSGLTDTVQPEHTHTNSNDVEHVDAINGKSSGLADSVQNENIQINNSFDESKNGQCSGLTDTVQPENVQPNSNYFEHVDAINGKSSGLADTVPQENIQTNNSGYDLLESRNSQCSGPTDTLKPENTQTNSNDFEHLDAINGIICGLVDIVQQENIQTNNIYDLFESRNSQCSGLTDTVQPENVQPNSNDVEHSYAINGKSSGLAETFQQENIKTNNSSCDLLESRNSQCSGLTDALKPENLQPNSNDFKYLDAINGKRCGLVDIVHQGNIQTDNIYDLFESRNSQCSGLPDTVQPENTQTNSNDFEHLDAINGKSSDLAETVQNENIQTNNSGYDLLELGSSQCSGPTDTLKPENLQPNSSDFEHSYAINGKRPGLAETVQQENIQTNNSGYDLLESRNSQCSGLTDALKPENLQPNSNDFKYLDAINGKSCGLVDIAQQENIQTINIYDLFESRNSQRSGLPDTVQPENTQTNSNDFEHLDAINGKSSDLAETVQNENIQTNNSGYDLLELGSSQCSGPTDTLKPENLQPNSSDFEHSYAINGKRSGLAETVQQENIQTNNSGYDLLESRNSQCSGLTDALTPENMQPNSNDVEHSYAINGKSSGLAETFQQENIKTNNSSCDLLESRNSQCFGLIETLKPENMQPNSNNFEHLDAINGKSSGLADAVEPEDIKLDSSDYGSLESIEPKCSLAAVYTVNPKVVQGDISEVNYLEWGNEQSPDLADEVKTEDIPPNSSVYSLDATNGQSSDMTDVVKLEDIKLDSSDYDNLEPTDAKVSVAPVCIVNPNVVQRDISDVNDLEWINEQCSDLADEVQTEKIPPNSNVYNLDATNGQSSDMTDVVKLEDIKLDSSDYDNLESMDTKFSVTPVCIVNPNVVQRDISEVNELEWINEQCSDLADEVKTENIQLNSNVYNLDATNGQSSDMTDVVKLEDIKLDSSDYGNLESIEPKCSLAAVYTVNPIVVQRENSNVNDLEWKNQQCSAPDTERFSVLPEVSEFVFIQPDLSKPNHLKQNNIDIKPENLESGISNFNHDDSRSEPVVTDILKPDYVESVKNRFDHSVAASIVTLNSNELNSQKGTNGLWPSVTDAVRFGSSDVNSTETDIKVETPDGSEFAVTNIVRLNCRPTELYRQKLANGQWSSVTDAVRFSSTDTNSTDTDIKDETPDESEYAVTNIVRPNCTELNSQKEAIGQLSLETDVERLVSTDVNLPESNIKFETPDESEFAVTNNVRLNSAELNSPTEAIGSFETDVEVLGSTDGNLPESNIKVETPDESEFVETNFVRLNSTEFNSQKGASGQSIETDVARLITTDVNSAETYLKVETPDESEFANLQASQFSVNNRGPSFSEFCNREEINSSVLSDVVRHGSIDTTNESNEQCSVETCIKSETPGESEFVNLQTRSGQFFVVSDAPRSDFSAFNPQEARDRLCSDETDVILGCTDGEVISQQCSLETNIKPEPLHDREYVNSLPENGTPGDFRALNHQEATNELCSMAKLTTEFNSEDFNADGDFVKREPFVPNENEVAFFKLKEELSSEVTDDITPDVSEGNAQEFENEQSSGETDDVSCNEDNEDISVSGVNCTKSIDGKYCAVTGTIKSELTDKDTSNGLEMDHAMESNAFAQSNKMVNNSVFGIVNSNIGPHSAAKNIKFESYCATSEVVTNSMQNSVQSTPKIIAKNRVVNSTCYFNTNLIKNLQFVSTVLKERGAFVKDVEAVEENGSSIITYDDDSNANVNNNTATEPYLVAHKERNAEQKSSPINGFTNFNKNHPLNTPYRTAPVATNGKFLPEISRAGQNGTPIIAFDFSNFDIKNNTLPTQYPTVLNQATAKNASGAIDTTGKLTSAGVRAEENGSSIVNYYFSNFNDVKNTEANAVPVRSVRKSVSGARKPVNIKKPTNSAKTDLSYSQTSLLRNFKYDSFSTDDNGRLMVKRIQQSELGKVETFEPVNIIINPSVATNNGKRMNEAQQIAAQNLATENGKRQSTNVVPTFEPQQRAAQVAAPSTSEPMRVTANTLPTGQNLATENRKRQSTNVVPSSEPQQRAAQVAAPSTSEPMRFTANTLPTGQNLATENGKRQRTNVVPTFEPQQRAAQVAAVAPSTFEPMRFTANTLPTGRNLATENRKRQLTNVGTFEAQQTEPNGSSIITYDFNNVNNTKTMPYTAVAASTAGNALPNTAHEAPSSFERFTADTLPTGQNLATKNGKVLFKDTGQPTYVVPIFEAGANVQQTTEAVSSTFEPIRFIAKTLPTGQNPATNRFDKLLNFGRPVKAVPTYQIITDAIQNLAGRSAKPLRQLIPKPVFRKTIIHEAGKNDKIIIPKMTGLPLNRTKKQCAPSPKDKRSTKTTD